MIVLDECRALYLMNVVHTKSDV